MPLSPAVTCIFSPSFCAYFSLQHPLLSVSYLICPKQHPLLSVPLYLTYSLLQHPLLSVSYLFCPKQPPSSISSAVSCISPPISATTVSLSTLFYLFCCLFSYLSATVSSLPCPISAIVSLLSPTVPSSLSDTKSCLPFPTLSYLYHCVLPTLSYLCCLSNMG